MVDKETTKMLEITRRSAKKGIIERQDDKDKINKVGGHSISHFWDFATVLMTKRQQSSGCEQALYPKICYNACVYTLDIL